MNKEVRYIVAAALAGDDAIRVSSVTRSDNAVWSLSPIDGVQHQRMVWLAASALVQQAVECDAMKLTTTLDPMTVDLSLALAEELFQDAKETTVMGVSVGAEIKAQLLFLFDGDVEDALQGERQGHDDDNR